MVYFTGVIYVILCFDQLEFYPTMSIQMQPVYDAIIIFHIQVLFAKQRYQLKQPPESIC